MKFNVSTSGSFYSKRAADKLRRLGFVFSEQTEPSIMKDGLPAEYLGGEGSVTEIQLEIETLDQLIAFANKWGELIVTDGEIEIYDDYRE